ncbi:asparagine synthase (glutamine-hydrolyzing) [Burkholderia gladioli]|uniref:asparagine synthase (glutamine-hydrolyzing) n=1 Tax=Burkholderia gladioli TaxID=28095 RepID=UPI003132F524
MTVCGIAGLFDLDASRRPELACLKGMLARLRHRGPDEMGYYIDDTVALGNARLSIVDLAGGQQPVGDDAGRHWIVFNGEIYNYRAVRRELEARGVRFQSNSDTEVLLRAWIEWGPAALERLNGAYAFCLYDRADRSIVLARDRFGKRPLFYTKHDGMLMFASEMKCFLASDSFRFRFAPERLASVFRIWTPLDDHGGAFAEIDQVPAGSYLRVRDGRFETVCHAPLRLDVEPLAVDEQEAAERVREALSDSVRLRLDADVEVGIYLSGGLDSAIVASLVREQKGDGTRSFSIGFDDGEFDESGDQQLMARHLGTRHVSVDITHRDIAQAFPDALWHAETPVFRTAFVPMYLLSREVRRNGIKVVLTGEGADEAYLGYDIFKETLLREAWHELDPDSRHARLARMYPYLPQFDERNRASMYGFFNQFAGGRDKAFFSHDLRFHNSQLSMRLLAQRDDPLRALDAQVSADPRFAALAPVQRAQWLEFRTLLGGYLLSTQGDRMSLAHGVENRCPFLDPAVVRLGFATNLRFGDAYDEKYLLKRAFAARLPERLLSKPKQPYRAPDASAFLSCRPDYLEALRSEHELARLGVLDARFGAAFVERLLARPAGRIGQAENQTLLFLLSTVLLHRQFVERQAPPPPAIEPLLTRQIDGRVTV